VPVIIEAVTPIHVAAPAADDRLSPSRPLVAMAMIAAASTTMPAMITNTSNCGRPTTATGPVGFTIALCMEWNSPAINTLKPALL
jgi:hypothetical protein